MKKALTQAHLQKVSSRHTFVGGIHLQWDSACSGLVLESVAIPSELLGTESRASPFSVFHFEGTPLAPSLSLLAHSPDGWMDGWMDRSFRKK